MKKFTAYYNGRTLKVASISAASAIQTAAKVFRVKANKVSVQQN
jgi:hypothetical protein